MANSVLTIIHADCKKAGEIARMTDFLHTENNDGTENFFDLEKIDPTPEELLDGSSTEAENIRRFGMPSWYEWRMREWGTKRNANTKGYVPCDGETYATMWFETADTCPLRALEKLSGMFPQVNIVYSYAEAEDPGCNCGRGNFRGGVRISGEDHEDYSEEAMYTYASVFGEDLEDDEEWMD